jgi:putative redox protein
MVSPGLASGAGGAASPATMARQAGAGQGNLPTAEERLAALTWQGGAMTSNADSVHREVTIDRIANGVFVAANSRGGRLTFGTGNGTDFTPTELLLAAIGGCTSIDVDILTTRRAEPESFEVRAGGNRVRDADGNRLTDIEVTFLIKFPEGEDGDAARAVLPDVIKKSHDHLCTVGRTIENGTPITERVG